MADVVELPKINLPAGESQILCHRVTYKKNLGTLHLTNKRLIFRYQTGKFLAVERSQLQGNAKSYVKKIKNSVSFHIEALIGGKKKTVKFQFVSKAALNDRQLWVNALQAPPRAAVRPKSQLSEQPFSQPPPTAAPKAASAAPSSLLDVEPLRKRPKSVRRDPNSITQEEDELARRRAHILANDEKLNERYVELVEEKKYISVDDFWNGRQAELARDASLRQQRVGLDSQMGVRLQDHMSSAAANVTKIRLDPQLIHQIFVEHPHVEAAYKKHVPHHMTEHAFWQIFVKSRTFHRAYDSSYDESRMGGQSEQDIFEAEAEDAQSRVKKPKVRDNTGESSESKGGLKVERVIDPSVDLSLSDAVVQNPEEHDGRRTDLLRVSTTELLAPAERRLHNKRQVTRKLIVQFNNHARKVVESSIPALPTGIGAGSSSAVAVIPDTDVAGAGGAGACDYHERLSEALRLVDLEADGDEAARALVPLRLDPQGNETLRALFQPASVRTGPAPPGSADTRLLDEAVEVTEHARAFVEWLRAHKPAEATASQVPTVRGKGGGKSLKLVIGRGAEPAGTVRTDACPPVLHMEHVADAGRSGKVLQHLTAVAHVSYRSQMKRSSGARVGSDVDAIVYSVTGGLDRRVDPRHVDMVRKLASECTELLRHFWSCFPVNSESQAKLVAMAKAVERMYDFIVARQSECDNDGFNEVSQMLGPTRAALYNALQRKEEYDAAVKQKRKRLQARRSGTNQQSRKAVNKA